jgi:hypothetical protein
MTRLPSNLAVVGDDLARATLIDARRSLRRRRLVTYAVAFALLALTGSVAIANGWLFDETPTLRAVPSLGGGHGRGAFAPSNGIMEAAGLTQSEAQHRAVTPGTDNSPPLGIAKGAESRTLLANLGAHRRVLSVVATTSGGVCIALTGFQVQCIPTFAAEQEISWFTSSPPSGPTIIWGIARDEVTGVEAVSGDGSTTAARFENGGFYVELTDGPPTRLIVRLSDGSSEAVTPLPCPLTTPACTP